MLRIYSKHASGVKKEGSSGFCVGNPGIITLISFTTKLTARQSGNQNEKSRIHHEGTLRLNSGQAPDTKGAVGCASRTGRSRNISRKEHKGRKEKKLISELGVLGVLARGISESEGSSAPGKFAQAAEIIMDSSTKDTKNGEPDWQSHRVSRRFSLPSCSSCHSW